MLNPLAHHNKINILMVDDHEDNLVSLEAVLQAPEYNLVSVTSGADALRALLEQEFALILLDVQMPELDGFQTASIIKQRECSKTIPIIFITAISSDNPFVYRGYGVGAVDYLVKPFDPYILKSKVSVFAEHFKYSHAIKVQNELALKAERLLLERSITNFELQALRKEKEANQRYRELIEGIDNGVVWFANPNTMSFSFVSQHAENILGYPVSEWSEDPNFWENHTHPEDRQKVLDAFKQATMTENEQSVDHRFLSARGEIVWFHTCVRFTKSQGELRGISFDLTNLKETELVLQKAIRAREELLSIASHELKTPITSMKLQLELAQRQLRNAPALQPDGKIESYFQKFNTQIKRLQNLIDNLLDVTRFDTGQWNYHLEQADLSKLVQNVVDCHSEELEASRCSVELSLAPDVRGFWDCSRIDQVIVNLLSNAIKYSPGTPLHVCVRMKDDQAMLEVRDHGPGVPPQNQARIFERFKRGTASHNVSGLGLGLFITQQIVNFHHGSVQLKSSPGNGATFTVLLPTDLTQDGETGHIRPLTRQSSGLDLSVMCQ